MPRLSTAASATHLLDDQNLERLVLMLRSAGAAGVTIAELLAAGVAAPAQSVYELQVAGYDIDRAYRTDPGGLRKVAYRLRVTEPRQFDV